MQPTKDHKLEQDKKNLFQLPRNYFHHFLGLCSPTLLVYNFPFVDGISVALFESIVNDSLNALANPL